MMAKDCYPEQDNCILASVLVPDFSETFDSKQNRESTEGYSKSIVRKNNDKFGKRIGLNKQNICKS